KAEFVRSLHDRARLNIEKRNEQLTRQLNKGRRKVTFEPGDWVWIHMRKERFPAQRRSKLSPRGDGPFQVLEKVNDNAYRLELPGEYGVHATFNVADLSPFDVGDDQELRTTPFQAEGNDANRARSMNCDNHALGDLKAPLVSLGPLPRARAKQMCEGLQLFVKEVQARVGSIHEDNQRFLTLLQVMDNEGESKTKAEIEVWSRQNTTGDKTLATTGAGLVSKP
ncbi:MAG: hypothetical protein CBHOC_5389, partial [uncultured Caballeronia sp.]